MAHLNVISEVTGTVWKIEAEVGATVDADDTILIVESMKMEIPVVATDAGRIVEIRVKEGDSVQDGQTVAVIEA